MYGVISDYEGKLIHATAYAGSRVPDYTARVRLPESRDAIGGAALRFDLRDLASPIPFTSARRPLVVHVGAGAQSCRATARSTSTGGPRATRAHRPGAPLDGHLANEHFQLRDALQDVTNVVLDVTLRHTSTGCGIRRWLEPRPDAPRRYLDLGPVLPQLFASLRAGTLIAENVDVCCAARRRIDLTPDRSADYVSPSYAEVGGALEVRLRRTLSVGASALSRQTERHDLSQRRSPTSRTTPSDSRQPSAIRRARIHRDRNVGEDVARRAQFSAWSRSTAGAPATRSTTARWPGDVPTDATPACRLPRSAAGAGSRSMRGSASGSGCSRLRPLERLDFAPDITGYKSLRLMMEGVY